MYRNLGPFIEGWLGLVQAKLQRTYRIRTTGTATQHVAVQVLLRSETSFAVPCVSVDVTLFILF